MIKRVFNLLFSACGVWIALLIFNWFYLVALIGPLPILAIGAIPLGAVLIIHYIIGNYIDLF